MTRLSAKNKQRLWYANIVSVDPVTTGETETYTDADGNVYTYDIEDGYDSNEYELPTEFYANISFNGGNINFGTGSTDFVEFGISNGDFTAIVVTRKGEVPLNNTSLIWYETEPVIVDGKVDISSADYKIKKLSPSLNVDKYLLIKVVKNEND